MLVQGEPNRNQLFWGTQLQPNCHQSKPQSHSSRGTSLPRWKVTYRVIPNSENTIVTSKHHLFGPFNGIFPREYTRNAGFLLQLPCQRSQPFELQSQLICDLLFACGVVRLGERNLLLEKWLALGTRVILRPALRACSGAHKTVNGCGLTRIGKQLLS